MEKVFQAQKRADSKIGLPESHIRMSFAFALKLCADISVSNRDYEKYLKKALEVLYKNTEVPNDDILYLKQTVTIANNIAYLRSQILSAKDQEEQIKFATIAYKYSKKLLPLLERNKYEKLYKAKTLEDFGKNEEEYQKTLSQIENGLKTYIGRTPSLSQDLENQADLFRKMDRKELVNQLEKYNKQEKKEALKLFSIFYQTAKTLKKDLLKEIEEVFEIAPKTLEFFLTEKTGEENAKKLLAPLKAKKSEIQYIFDTIRKQNKVATDESVWETATKEHEETIKRRTK